MTDADRIVDALKDVLREQGMTYAVLARRIGVSEATVKRTFSQRSFTLDRLQRICDAVGISMFDLGRRARAEAESELYRLTLSQERRLVADVGLFYFFWMLVNRHAVASIRRRYRVPERKLHRWLVELDRMGIIELRDGLRYTLRVPSNIVWNEDGPIERLMVSRSVPLFLRGRFSRDDEYFRFIVGKLSTDSIAIFRTQLQRLAEQIFTQSVGTDVLRADSKATALVVAFGPADFSLRDVVAGSDDTRQRG